MNTQKEILRDRLSRLIRAFSPLLYEDDDVFLANMKSRNLAGDDIRRYQHWEWTQGVGIFGLWRLYEKGEYPDGAEILSRYFDRQLAVGFPALNVNTAAPFLTMALFGERLGLEKYLLPCRDAADRIMTGFPRTREGGFQHMTSDSLNDQELWDDTLFMAVLFLAQMGRIEGREDWIREAEKQFLLHARYLADPGTGLWYHGWTFNGNHHFAGAFWARGNSWITMAVPEFLALREVSSDTRAALTKVLDAQVRALVACQDPGGMWHTLLDDPSSYVESSATCGIGYGMLRASRMGLLSVSCEAAVEKALARILPLIDDQGVLGQVSYGTPMGRDSRDFYKQIPIRPMPYGQALAMLFLAECLA